MSAHFRELSRVFNECLSCADAFDATLTIDDAQPIKQLFRLKTIVAAGEEASGASSSGGSFKEVHVQDALVRVCNALLRHKGGERSAQVDALLSVEETRLAWKFVSVFASDKAAMCVIDESLTRAAVDLHYTTSRPRQFDMFVHLSASEMFFIDGDSLLMAALSQQQVDWDLMQPLHVIHNAQALLRRMQSRGARFHVVFFENAKWFWEKAPQKLFIRENLRATLKLAAETNPATEIVVGEFPSYHSEEFAAYVAQYEPEFLLMSDGEQLGTPNSLHALFNNPNVGPADEKAPEEGLQSPYRSLVEDERLGDEVSLYYRCFLSWATAQHIKVAYSSRIVARENAIVVFAVTVDSDRFARSLAVQSGSVQIATALERPVALPVIDAASVTLPGVDEIPLRDRVVSGAVHAYLNAAGATRTESEKQLCQALVMSAYCAPLISADLRAQRGAIALGVSAFLNDIAPYLVQVLAHHDCSAGRGTEVDLVDGHLLAIMAFHLKRSSAADLLDADGAGDVNMQWQDIVGDDAADITSAPLSALPDVELLPPRTAITYPHFTHELVERLAKSFAVEGHFADRPFPASFGNANNLSGWDVSTPFDKMNDVVDVYVEEETQRNMTEKDRKRFLMMEAAFVTDAAQQAESMGIRGFTSDRLAIVCSDDDDDGDGDDKDDKKGKRAHTGQNNKKVRSKEDIIREEANLREANRTVRDWLHQMDSVIKSTEVSADRANAKDRVESIGVLSAALSRLRQAGFGRSFDPGEVLKDAEPVPLKLAMWRLLVETSGMREAEFAFTLDDKQAQQSAGAKKSSGVSRRGGGGSADALAAFGLITKLIQDSTSSGANTTNWGKLERLRTVKKQMTVFDASSYLCWVYLSYVHLHFQMKLMCRIVRLHLDTWKAERERARLAQEQPDIKVGTPLFLYCHYKALAVIRDYGVSVSTDELDTVRSALAHFDFPADYYDKVDRAIARWQSRAVPPLPPALRPRQKICTETPEMMQLMHMGHLLERPMIPEKDYRVVFNPDGWQRDLLDIVDARGSAVVCAPTSAGKTFISYYCMYNALKTSNTKVVVYVAPNRALINQAVADVCARYGSKKYALPGKNVYGVHGGAEYHRYHDSCQVLVTLPEVLETLLLSPNYKDWVSRLDYVVLDEIHTMESSGNGDVWERVLALLPCPFVALSATLGETQQLCGWLNRVQDRLRDQQAHQQLHRKRDYEVHDIPSSGAIQRWNDIKKYIYLPPPGYRPQLKKLTAKYEQTYVRDLHPLSILTLDQLRRGFPPDISLVPSEVVQLHEQMTTHFAALIASKWAGLAVAEAMRTQLQDLHPEAFFKECNYITQRHARAYEAEVKNAFAYWVYLTTGDEADGFAELTDEQVTEFNENMHSLCVTILQAFSQHLRQDEASLNQYATKAVADKLRQEQQESTTAATTTGPSSPSAAAAAASTETAFFPDSKQFIGANIISVLRELNSRDMGPTIVFSFESEDCDDLVKTVVEQLELAESLYRLTDEFAQYQASMERKAAAQAAARKQRESTLKQKKLNTNDDGDVERADRDIDDMDDDEHFVVPDVLPEFTFIGQSCTVDPVVVKNAIAECEKRGDDLAARAIRRGVGVHHAGVKGKLRRLMEILFRGRHCGVICATETLALGVHSPCRSVVLAGDHVLLNTTQFRQMMGRAGRRGLDYMGHLIFLSVSMKKITRLMTSSMTVIKGNVQVDPITQLRMLQLYDYGAHRNAKNPEEWSDTALALAERLYVNPLFFEGRASVEGGNMEAFSVEYLQMLLGFFHKEGLHFRDRPSSLGSLLVDAMHVFRNAQVGAEGFSFISLLTRGVLDGARFSDDLAYLNSGVYQDGVECTEAAAEILAYVFSTNKMCGVPLEIHRSALSDPAVLALWEKRPNMKQHRVVLAPLHACAAKSVLDNASALRVISAFYTFLANGLQTAADDRLPYMSVNTRKKNPIFGKRNSALPLTAKLQETAVAFAARDPFVALSGCGDHFANAEDLVSTLRRGLFCDCRMLPLLDLTDSCRHDGAQVLINACVSDFVRCRAQIDSLRSNYRFTLLEEINGLTQSESFAILNQVERLLSNIAGLVRSEEMPRMQVIEALFPNEAKGTHNAGASHVISFAERLHELRTHIDKDLATDQFRARREEMMRNRSRQDKK